MAGVIELPHIIPELLSYRAAPLEDCVAYKDLRHDDDLCPKLEEQLRVVLDGFLKYSAVVYDVQGFQDRGSDVVLRFCREGGDENPWRYVAFQIKSYHDLQTDRYLWKNLKSQFFDAATEYGDQLEHYYILVCTTYDKKERRKLRLIKKTFATTTNVTVIDPAYVLTFLRMSRGRVNITVEALLRDEDIVFERAQKLVEDEPPTRAALVVALCERSAQRPGERLSVESLAEDDFVSAMYSHLPDYDADDFGLLAEGAAEGGPHPDGAESPAAEEDEEPLDDWDDEVAVPVDRGRSLRERLGEDVEEFVGDCLTRQGENHYTIDVDYYHPISALLMDARARYGYTGSQLSEYVFTALRVLEPYGLDYPSSFEEGGGMRLGR